MLNVRRNFVFSILLTLGISNAFANNYICENLSLETSFETVIDLSEEKLIKIKLNPNQNLGEIIFEYVEPQTYVSSANENEYAFKEDDSDEVTITVTTNSLDEANLSYTKPRRRDSIDFLCTPANP